MKTKVSIMTKLWTLSLAVLLLASGLEAANLHSIIICDTQADNIGSSVEADLNRVRAEMHRAAYYTKMNVREKLFTEHEVDSDIINWIRDYPIESGDVVFVFFSGHGYRTDSKEGNVWPNLYLTPANKGVDFAHLVQIINDKSPRLMIAIADCCNNVLPEAYAPPLLKDRSYASSYRKPSVKKNYQKLFLQTHGTIVASSSIPGQFSWGTKSGGLFTLALFDSLNHEVNSFNPGWGPVFNRASTAVIDREVGQVPQFELSINE